MYDQRLLKREPFLSNERHKRHNRKSQHNTLITLTRTTQASKYSILIPPHLPMNRLVDLPIVTERKAWFTEYDLHRFTLNQPKLVKQPKVKAIRVHHVHSPSSLLDPPPHAYPLHPDGGGHWKVCNLIPTTLPAKNYTRKMKFQATPKKDPRFCIFLSNFCICEFLVLAALRMQNSRLDISDR